MREPVLVVEKGFINPDTLLTMAGKFRILKVKFSYFCSRNVDAAGILWSLYYIKNEGHIIKGMQGSQGGAGDA